MSDSEVDPTSCRRLLNDLTSPREAFESAMKLHSQELGRFFLARLMGFEVSYGSSRCFVDFEVREFLHNPRGILQGGVLAMGFDIAMGHLTQHLTGPAATVAIDVRYHRPVSVGRVRIAAQTIHRGARIWTLNAEARLENELLASATGTFTLLGTK